MFQQAGRSSSITGRTRATFRESPRPLIRHIIFLFGEIDVVEGTECVSVEWFSAVRLLIILIVVLFLDLFSFPFSLRLGNRSVPPDVVVFAETTDHVMSVASYCDQHKLPLIPFGTGTGLEGGVNAISVSAFLSFPLTPFSVKDDLIFPYCDHNPAPGWSCTGCHENESNPRSQ